MDRLTASSTPNWPLPAHPHPSLVNVPKESKRHCRLLPAGMVNLSLAQMADAVKVEEQKMKRLVCWMVEGAEQVVEKCVSKRMVGKGEEEEEEEEEEEKKKWKERIAEAERRKMRRKVVVERNSLVEMIEAANALLASSMLHMEVIEPPKMSSIAVIEQHPSPTASMIDIAELDACDTAITTKRPSTGETCKNPAVAEASTITATTVILPSARPIDPTDPISFDTALHSNPPSSSDLAHARNLIGAHLKRTMTTNAVRERQTMGTQNAQAAFDMVTQYGTVGRRTMLKRYVSVARKTKLSVSEAVHRGFRGIFR